MDDKYRTHDRIPDELESETQVDGIKKFTAHLSTELVNNSPMPENSFEPDSVPDLPAPPVSNNQKKSPPVIDALVGAQSPKKSPPVLPSNLQPGSPMMPTKKKGSPLVRGGEASPYNAKEKSSLPNLGSSKPKKEKKKKNTRISKEDAQQSLASNPRLNKREQKEKKYEAKADPSFYISTSEAYLMQNPALSIYSASKMSSMAKKAPGVGDEFNDVLTAMSNIEAGEKVMVQMSIRNINNFSPIAQQALNEIKMTGRASPIKPKNKVIGMVEKIKKYITKFNHMMSEAPPPPPKPITGSDVSEEMKDSLKAAADKFRAPAHMETALRVIVTGKRDREEMIELLREDIEKAIRVSFSDSNTNQGFAFRKCLALDALIGYMPLEQNEANILSNVEIAEIMKIPDSSTNPGHSLIVQRAKIKWLPLYNGLVVEDPLNPPPGIIPFGIVHEGSDREQIIGMSVKDLDTHLYFCGATGTGKSNLLQWIAFGLVKNNQQIVMVDPHGTLVDETVLNISAFAPERLEDVVIADFGLRDNPIAFNPLDVSSFEEIEGTVASVQEMFMKAFKLDANVAVRAANYVALAVTALCEANLYLPHEIRTTMLQITTFLTDEDFRRLIMEFCTNHGVREYFQPEGFFESLSDKARSEHIAPIMRAFSPLNNNESFANIFGQSINKMDYDKFVRENKILLLRFPKFSNTSSQITNLIGSLTIPLLLRGIGAWQGASCHLIIDEFQNYASDSYVELLAEARKYKLRSIATSQIPTALPSNMQTAIYGNARNKMTLSLDRDNVAKMAKSISGATDVLRPEHIASLPSYYGYANIMINAAQSGPFTFKGLAPIVMDKEAAKTDFESNMQIIEQTSIMNLSNGTREEVAEHRRDHVEKIKASLASRLHDKQRKGGGDMWDNIPTVHGLPEGNFDPSADDFDDEDW